MQYFFPQKNVYKKFKCDFLTCQTLILHILYSNSIIYEWNNVFYARHVSLKFLANLFESIWSTLFKLIHIMLQLCIIKYKRIFFEIVNAIWFQILRRERKRILKHFIHQTYCLARWYTILERCCYLSINFKMKIKKMFQVSIYNSCNYYISSQNNL